MKKEHFTWETPNDHGISWEGFHHTGDTWNGWEKPWFTPDVALEIVRYIRNTGCTNITAEPFGEWDGTHEGDGEFHPCHTTNHPEHGTLVRLGDGWIWETTTDAKDIYA